MRRGQINPRSWDAAIRAVKRNIVELPTQFPVTDEQERILGTVQRLCDELTARRYLAWPQTNRDLASKYGISERTVTNWRREGCPFACGQWRVLDWLARRRYAPAGARARFSRQLAERKRKAPWVAVYDSVRRIRELKRQYVDNGLEAPEWLRRFRASRRKVECPHVTDALLPSA